MVVVNITLVIFSSSYMYQYYSKNTRDLVIRVTESTTLQQLVALTTLLPMKLLVHINVKFLLWLQQIYEPLTGRFDDLKVRL